MNEYSFDFVLALDKYSDTSELQKLEHHFEYLVDFSQYDIEVWRVHVDINANNTEALIVGHCSGTDALSLVKAVDEGLAEWPEVSMLKAFHIRRAV
jgi:hypothetical protein